MARNQARASLWRSRSSTRLIAASAIAKILDRETRRIENRDVLIGVPSLGLTGKHIAELRHILAPEDPCFDRVHEVTVV